MNSQAASKRTPKSTPVQTIVLASSSSSIVPRSSSRALWFLRELHFEGRRKVCSRSSSSLGAAIAGSVESLCLPRRRVMNSKSPRPLGGTHEDNCSSIQQPHFECVLKVRMAASLMALCIAVLQLSSMESRPPDAIRSRNPKASTEPLFLLYTGHQTLVLVLLSKNQLD
ncbi:hypothetical protein BDL97_11G005100 [Sphagnum fallax]|nr:hypothetical protein BDL97_11G005100 [Sphagnum fallax]